MIRISGFAIFSFVVVLQSILGAPVIDLFNLEDEMINERATDPQYRLSTNFVPEHYNIRLSDIDFVNQTFSGSVDITFWCTAATSVLELHASPTLLITEIAVSIENLNASSTPVLHTIARNNEYEKLIITANTAFIFNTRYTIRFALFTGSLNHGTMRGFYRSVYTQDGNTQFMGTTQFQPGHARKAFPCFDEPSFKATFALSIRRPSADFSPSISNMKIDPDASSVDNWDNFLTTPVMSTYLIAFIVSKFVALNETTETNGDQFRVMGRSGAAGQGEYAFDEGRKLLTSMSTYMELDYYTMGNNKMDQAAIPDFSAGAMENWGLLTYREAYLLANEHTSVRYKQQISGILAHEIAHMWFGDYVTCHWWSDTWLNEGFARLFQYQMPDMVQTTNFNMMTQFPVLQVQTALLADTSIRAAALTHDVNSPTEVSGHFGTISYNKGASILRMMAHWIGETNFQRALNRYMTSNVFGVVVPGDLYTALQSTAPEGLNVEHVMSSWVTEAGYPVLSVDIDYNDKKMTITQERNHKPWEVPIESTYVIPITFATKSSANFDDTATNVLMDNDKTIEVSNLPLDGHEWLVLNKRQIGYFRVNYDEHTWQMLANTLRGGERTDIHQLNRGQIVDDVFNLAREDLLPYATTFDVLEFLINEDEYAPWQSAFPGFTFIRQQFNIDRDVLAKLDKYILLLLQNVVDTLGFEDSGDLLTQMFRLNTMNFACSVGQEDCVNFAKETYATFMASGTEVDPDLREFVYCTGLREGDDTAYDRLWSKYVSENLVNEQYTIMGVLGCTKSATKIRQLLDEIAKTDSIFRDQDMMTPINGILNGHIGNPEHVLSYLEDNAKFVALRTRLGSFSTLFNNLGSRLTGHQISRFHQLVIDNMGVLTSSEIAAGMTAYSTLAQQGTYMLKAGREIETWLDVRLNSGTLATTSIVLLLVTMLAHFFNYQS